MWITLIRPSPTSLHVPQSHSFTAMKRKIHALLSMFRSNFCASLRLSRSWSWKLEITSFKEQCCGSDGCIHIADQLVVNFVFRPWLLEKRHYYSHDKPSTSKSPSAQKSNSLFPSKHEARRHHWHRKTNNRANFYCEIFLLVEFLASTFRLPSSFNINSKTRPANCWLFKLLFLYKTLIARRLTHTKLVYKFNLYQWSPKNLDLSQRHQITLKSVIAQGSCIPWQIKPRLTVFKSVISTLVHFPIDFLPLIYSANKMDSVFKLSIAVTSFYLRRHSIREYTWGYFYSFYLSILIPSNFLTRIRWTMFP